MDQVFNASTLLAEANDPRYANVRIFTVTPRMSSTPQTNLLEVSQNWTHANASTLGNPQPFSYFSAICW